MIDEGAKRARPDILAADEAQPVEACSSVGICGITSAPKQRSKCSPAAKRYPGVIICAFDHYNAMSLQQLNERAARTSDESEVVAMSVDQALDGIFYRYTIS